MNRHSHDNFAAVAALFLGFGTSTFVFGQEEPVPKTMIPAVLEGHNRERAAEKLPPLSIDPKLTAAAQKHADDMAAHSLMSHQGSDGTSPFDRIKHEAYLYRTSGENVAYGQRSADSVMEAWLESPPHKENILGKFSQVGIAVATNSEGIPYWCVDFGTPWPKLDAAKLPKEIIDALNKARVDAKKSRLTSNRKLTLVANEVAESLAKNAELPPEKVIQTDLVALLKKQGYRYQSVSEAVAFGMPTPDEVVKSWLEDPQQKDNVLGKFEDAGLGCFVSKSGAPYWCLILGRSQ